MLDLESLIKLVWRWLWLLILGALLGAAATYWALNRQGLLPSYRAVVTLSVGAQFESISLSGEELAMGEDLVPSYVVLAERPPVTQAVVDRLNLPVSAEELVSSKLEVQQVGQTRIIEIVAKDPDPETAAAIANEVGRQLVRSAPVRPYQFIQVTAPAKVPEEPSTEPYLIIAIGGLVGMLLAAVVAAVIELKQDRPRTLSWAASRIDMPLLGTFRRKRTSILRRVLWWKRLAPADWDPPEPVWWVVIETLKRVLAAEDGDDSGEFRIVVVTSPLRSKGRPMAALELGRAWATTGNRVAVVDAVPNRPTLHSWFGLPNDKGLTTILAQAGESDTAGRFLSDSGIDNLRVLTSGPKLPKSGALLSQPAWEDLLAGLRNEADVVIFSSPPAATAPEAIILGAQAHGVLVVVDLGKTPAAAANRSAEMLLTSGCKVLGAVVSTR